MARGAEVPGVVEEQEPLDGVVEEQELLEAVPEDDLPMSLKDHAKAVAGYSRYSLMDHTKAVGRYSRMKPIMLPLSAMICDCLGHVVRLCVLFIFSKETEKTNFFVGPSLQLQALVTP